jgi:hypothetical protein
VIFDNGIHVRGESLGRTPAPADRCCKATNTDAHDVERLLRWKQGQPDAKRGDRDKCPAEFKLD